MPCTVTTPSLDEATLSELKTILKIFISKTQILKLEFKIDASIVGGIVVQGNQALPWDCEESIPRTHTWEIVVWQVVYSCRRLSPCPLSLFPVMKNRQSCSQQGQHKIQCPEFLLHIKAYPFEAHAVFRGPQLLLDTWSCVPGWERISKCTAQVWVRREQELLSFLGLYELAFGTDQVLSKK